MSDYWHFKKQDGFIEVDKSFCIFVDHLQEDKDAKIDIAQKILFFSKHQAIIPHHCPFESFQDPDPVKAFKDHALFQANEDYAVFQGQYLNYEQKFYMVSPSSVQNNVYHAFHDEDTYKSAVQKQQKKTYDNVIKIYPEYDNWQSRKWIKLYAVGQKILPMGYECRFKYNKKAKNFALQHHKAPIILKAELLQAAVFFHQHLKASASLYQTYYFYEKEDRKGEYLLHKTVASDGAGYSNIALSIEKNAKKLERYLKTLPPHIQNFTDILPINHLVYIPIFHQFLRQKNASYMHKAATQIQDTLESQEKNIQDQSGMRFI